MSEASTYSSVLQCDYGTSRFALEQYEVTETPVIKEGVGRVFTNVQIEATGYIDATEQGDYSDTLAAIQADCGIDGRDFLVLGLGGAPEYALLAARCMNGGPHVSMKMLPQAPLMHKRFKIGVKADRTNAGNKPSNSYKVTTHTRPDGLLVITWAGTVIGVNSMAFFLNTVLPQVQGLYPLPGWVQEYEATASTDSQQSSTSYTVHSIQNFSALPNDGTGIGATANGSNAAVEGELTRKVSSDEQHQILTTYDFNFLIVGDPQVILTKLRKLATSGASSFLQGDGGKTLLILRENYSITTIREQRLTGSIATLESGDSAPLLKWTETLAVKSCEAGYEVKHYPGAGVVLVHRPAGVGVIRQSGSATAVGKFFKPTPLFPTTYLSSPEVKLTDENDVVKGTSWDFEMYASAGGDGTTIDPFGNGSADDPDPNFDIFKSLTGALDPGVLARAKQKANYYGAQNAGGN